jgi:hypothetical protein
MSAWMLSFRAPAEHPVSLVLMFHASSTLPTYVRLNGLVFWL